MHGDDHEPAAGAASLEQTTHQLGQLQTDGSCKNRMLGTVKVDQGVAGRADRMVRPSASHSALSIDSNEA